MRKRSFKNPQHFKAGEMIYVCGWLPVEQDAVIDDIGYVYLVVIIPLLRYPQRIKLGDDELFECMESEVA